MTLGSMFRYTIMLCTGELAQSGILGVQPAARYDERVRSWYYPVRRGREVVVYQ